jgi:hypothetical protein
LWISAPSAPTTAQVDGQTYVILGRAGSDSLSVIAVGAGGTLTITDHLLDDRNSRFGGVAALDVVTVGGHSYVVSGGDDIMFDFGGENILTLQGIGSTAGIDHVISFI